MESEFEQLKKDFTKWSGFPLEATEREDILNEIRGRQWDLENEIAMQASSFEQRIMKLFPLDV